MRRVGLGAVALAVVVLLAGCGDGEDRPGPGSGSGSGTGTGSGSASGVGSDEHGEHESANKASFGQSEADTVVSVTMRDYAFTGISPTVKGKKVFFQVENQGPAPHELLVMHPDGKVAAGIEPFARGETKTVAAELEPGTYKVECLVREGAKTHAELGMATTFIVE